MNKIYLALSLMLAPFLSLASENIFTNGDVPIKSPKFDNEYEYNCAGAIGDVQACADGVMGRDYSADTFRGVSCSGQVISTTPPTQISEISCTGEYLKGYLYNDVNFPDWQTFEQVLGRFTGTQKVNSSCPPDEFPQNTFPLDQSGNGDVDGCANPQQISLVDDCNASSGNEFLSMPVTSGSGCYPTGNGSICKYDAVTFDSGMTAYAMDLEGDCYSDNDLPDLSQSSDGSGSQTPIETPTSQDDTCNEWGGTGMICPENPQDVCDDLGNCQDGCGSVNGVFTCIDNDLDADNIPDYLDPDIDGDGVPNGIDLDNDGDGLDDPIDNSGGGSGNSSGSSVNVDMSGVVSELKKLNKTTDDLKKSLTETDVELQTAPTAELLGFWESEYENGLQGVVDEKMAEVKATAFFQFLDQFKISTGGSSAVYDMCFNLGSMGNFGCHNFNIDSRTFPAIKIFILITAVFLCRRILFGG